MITKNFKNILKILMVGNNSKGVIEGRAFDGTIGYIAPYFVDTIGYPYLNEMNVRTYSSTTSGGIYLGRGTTPETEDDYQLSDRITSGISASSPVTQFHIDENGNPYVQSVSTLTNSTSSDIIINEIAYVQVCRLSTTLDGASTNKTLMFYRKVLDTPITVPANDVAILKFTIKAILSSPNVA